MKLIKLTMISDKGLLKTKLIKRVIWINPNNIDYIWDWTANDNNAVQTAIHMNGQRIYIEENFQHVMELLGIKLKKGEQK